MAILAIIVYAIQNAYINDARKQGEDMRTAKDVRNLFVVTVIVAYVAINALGSWLIGLDHGPSRASSASNNQVAADLFGFESGKVYPLQLSGQVTTLSANVDASMGFFSSAASATVNGGPAITASFTHDDVEYTLTLPRDKTKFVIDNNNSPTMVVRLKSDVYTTEANYDRTWTDCSFAFSNLLPICKRVATISSHVTASQTVINQGLGQLVADGFESAELHLPQGMRDQLLGAIR